MSENLNNEVAGSVENDSVKEIADALKKISVDSKENEEQFQNVQESEENNQSPEFKVASTNLPEKTGFWTKVKNALFYEIKVELTPYQQKIEDEINDFLHQEVTWKSFKSFLLKEVPITYKGKRIF